MCKGDNGDERCLTETRHAQGGERGEEVFRVSREGDIGKVQISQPRPHPKLRNEDVEDRGKDPHCS